MTKPKEDGPTKAQREAAVLDILLQAVEGLEPHALDRVAMNFMSHLKERLQAKK